MSTVIGSRSGLVWGQAACTEPESRSWRDKQAKYYLDMSAQGVRLGKLSRRKALVFVLCDYPRTYKLRESAERRGALVTLPERA